MMSKYKILALFVIAMAVAACANMVLQNPVCALGCKAKNNVTENKYEQQPAPKNNSTLQKQRN
jgi:lipopolysaccharide export LptBFGC system permease protein LptF